jgi:hypothetical protein
MGKQTPFNSTLQTVFHAFFVNYQAGSSQNITFPAEAVLDQTFTYVRLQ